MTDLAKRTIGRYQILEPLGQGGMATVYKGFDTLLEREVAVKIIRSDQFGSAVLESMLKRFEREAKALARLDDLHIVKVYDYGEYQGAPYLVMQYIPGGTLKERLGKPMHYLQAVRLLVPIARALAYAHKNGIIHRDVKPANILITESGEPLLSDFGIVKILEGEEGATLTGTGMGIGTPEYMAPEQWLGKATAASDLYSLGVVFYELVTGHKPYDADTPLAVMLKQINEPLPLPRQFVPGLPDIVEKVLIKALSKNPAERFPSMQSFAVILENLVSMGIREDSTLRKLPPKPQTSLPRKPQVNLEPPKTTKPPSPQTPLQQPGEPTWDEQIESRIHSNRTSKRKIGSEGWYWLISTIVPLLVVAIAMTIYTQLGKSESQQVYLQQARQVATQAVNESVLAQQRELWNQTLELIIKAEEFGENAETRHLHNEIDSGLDELDKVKRIAFSETMRSGLAENVNIIRMVSNGSDIYALDGSSGSVLRFVGASGKYEVDQTFICRPQNYSGVIVSSLVDLMPLPSNILANATVLAVDETGNLIYCGPNIIPTIQTLTPPDQYLGKVAGIAQSGRILLVLDKYRNMVWRYGDPQEDAENQAESLVDWTRAPQPYFQENTLSLTNVVDFVVNGDDLFLVDSNGQMTTCSYSASILISTRCQQPAEFDDPRPGRQSPITSFEGALFSHLIIDPLNRQSLYLLDQNNAAVYRLSLRLFLDKVFECDSSTKLPSGQPSAFVVTTNQYLLLAYGNRVFVARP